MDTAPTPSPVRTPDVLPRGRRDWWRFAKAVWHETSADHVLLLAAGVAFFAFISIFPALLATGLVYGLVTDPEQVEEQVREISDVLPEGAAELISNQLERLVTTSDESLGIGLIVALAVALWGASTATSNLIGAVNACYDHTIRRSFVRRRALAIAMTLGGIVFITVAVGLVAVTPAVIDALELPGWVRAFVQVIRWSVFVVGVLAALGVLYRVAPYRAGVDVRWTSFGAVVAMLLWVTASAGFSLYVSQFGTNYDSTYGPLAGVIVLMFWLWLGAIAALLGAEVNAELARRRHTTT
ncbi:MAG TPA: YihY/virulence factor BrkB family protein [Jiangellaceae bacterium]